MTKLTLEDNDLKLIFAGTGLANKRLKEIYPGDNGERQPVQTMYGGAHLFNSNTVKKIGELAVKSFNTYATDVNMFASAFDLDFDDKLTEIIYGKVIEKLNREPVEDFRIDFEDGFGIRPDVEEDETAENAAREVAKGMKENMLSPFIGIRIKTFSDELKLRSARTLDIFITTLLKESDNKLPDNFVVTLPKVTDKEHISSLVKIFDIIELKHSMKKGSLKMEIMIETTQSVFDSTGKANILNMVNAGNGRCKAAHFGVYDYTASCDVTASLQSMRHPACDFARNMMKVSLAGTGVWLSDGATNIMPVGIHKGENISYDEQKENLTTVHNAWKYMYADVTHSLSNAFYQGWDLHPAQLPVRYTAVYKFFLDGFGQASARLKNFIGKAAQATLVGDVFDDAATGQGLLNYFIRAYNCGAVTEGEILNTGITLSELKSKSFLKILENRKIK